MNLTPNRPPSPDQPLPRELLLTLLNTALSTGELRYARRLCTAWLASYPGDLQVNLLQARAYFIESSPSLRQNALPILEEICQQDPEYLEAQELLASARQLSGNTNHLVAKACANALSHGHAVKVGKNGRVSSWAKYVFEARDALHRVQAGEPQQIDKAEYFIHKALLESPDTPLAAIVHLKMISSKAAMPKDAASNLAQIYHERWPNCLQFQLALADAWMEQGETNQAVDLLHQVVAKDITGQVPRRMWGEQHRYTALWPESLVASPTGSNNPQNIPIPAAVASSLGWNQLSASSSNQDARFSAEETSHIGRSDFHQASAPLNSPTHTMHQNARLDDELALSSTTQSVQSELERMADELKRPHLVHENGRFPTYVVFTSRVGLAAIYNQAELLTIDTELKKLVKLVNGHRINQELWGSLLFYADDPTCTQPLGLSPVSSNDPGQLKLLLSDLDAALEKRGERIGALLIVGGPEVIPFHNLPNPVEDADEEVPSDNPYATRDNNYFISDWPVGRVTGGIGRDASQLIKILDEIANRYDEYGRKPAWYLRLIDYIRELFRKGLSKKLSSFGYTAAVWRLASLSVFRAIGNQDDMLVSPPVHTCEQAELTQAENSSQDCSGNPTTCLLLPNTRLAYFNLHGVPDASEWYGQCDPANPEDGPEFPVAMRPQDVRNGGSAPRMVFTEACYGANILGKSVDEAISLKFLASGTHAVVGSTCISYGSLSTPLAADLLGNVFWTLLMEGFTAGESLRRAKIHLTREMNNRQGFLDAEDQKTLISFVLYGDPLAQPLQVKVNPKTMPHLSDAAVTVPTVCEKSCEGEVGSSVSLETITHLKSVVAQYLPGMNDAEVNLYHEHQTCANLCGNCGSGKTCCLSQASAKNHIPIKTQRRIVTLSKNFERAQHIHRQYARLTLDDQGKIVKMVISH
jgi:tetratricopeptide (TPR) repeat protein